MTWRKTHLGYPGVDPSPTNPESSEGEPVTILKEDGANAVVRDSNGDTRTVPKSWLRR